MSHYKHPRELQTLTRSCTDRSTGAYSRAQSIYGSMQVHQNACTLNYVTDKMVV